jgi:hypothetical protein
MNRRNFIETCSLVGLAGLSVGCLGQDNRDIKVGVLNSRNTSEEVRVLLLKDGSTVFEQNMTLPPESVSDARVETRFDSDLEQGTELTAKVYNDGNVTEKSFILKCEPEESPGDLLTVKVRSDTVFVSGSNENASSCI